MEEEEEANVHQQRSIPIQRKIITWPKALYFSCPFPKLRKKKSTVRDIFQFSENIFFFRLLVQMGWKDGDEMTYEITDQDKEEYEKRIQHIPKVSRIIFDLNAFICLL